MRKMPVLSAGRVLTIISLTVLIALSFVAFTSNTPEHPTVHLRMVRRGIVVREPQPPPTTPPSPGPSGGDGDDGGPTGPPAGNPQEPPGSPSPQPPPPPTTPPTTPPTQPPTQPPPPPTQPPPTTRPNPPPPPPTTSTTTSTSSSTSTSTSTSTSSSTTSTSSTTLSTLTVTSTPGTRNLAPLPTTTFPSTPPAMTNIYGNDNPATTVEAPEITNTVTPTSRSDSSGFLSNTGAVAATFTVVGLLGIGAAVGLWVFCVRKRRREEEDIFEDEIRDYSTHNGYGGGRTSEEHIVGGPEMSYARSAPQLPSANMNAMLSGQPRGDVNSWAPEFSYTTDGSNRDSTISNHAGHGAHGLAPLQSKPTVTTNNYSSPLAREQWTAAAEYSQPAVTHAQPQMFVPRGRPSQSSLDSFYGASSKSNSVGTAH